LWRWRQVPSLALDAVPAGADLALPECELLAAS